VVLASIVSLTGGDARAATDSSGAINAVPTKVEAIQPILVGQAVPKLVLKGVDGADVALSALIAEKPSLLIFYRGGW
jgi:hypothetical protein